VEPGSEAAVSVVAGVSSSGSSMAVEQGATTMRNEPVSTILTIIFALKGHPCAF